MRDGAIDILVATPVIEVGIDIQTHPLWLLKVPSDSVFAQLHQLRGRVGRAGQRHIACCSHQKVLKQLSD